MLSLALLALGATVTFNAPYSGAVDFRLSVSRPGLGSSTDGNDPHDLRDFGWSDSDAEKHPVVNKLLWSAASGGCACPASLTTNDVQAFFEWRRGLDPARRAQADDALVLLRQADLDAQEEADRAEVEAEVVQDVPELALDDDAAAPFFEVVQRIVRPWEF